MALLLLNEHQKLDGIGYRSFFKIFAKSTKMTAFRRGDSEAHKRLLGKSSASIESLAADLARL